MKNLIKLILSHDQVWQLRYLLDDEIRRRSDNQSLIELYDQIEDQHITQRMGILKVKELVDAKS